MNQMTGSEFKAELAGNNPRITGKTITESIELDATLSVSEAVFIRQCTFVEHFTLRGTFNTVLFDNCRFKKGFSIKNDCKCDGSLSLSRLETDIDKIIIDGGNIKDFSLEINQIKNVTIKGGNFTTLTIQPSDINELYIESNKDLTGKIKIIDCDINRFTLRGVISKDDEIELIRIASNEISIGEFTNNGNLKLYDIKPLRPGDGLFTVFYSYLGKAQLNNISFNQFNNVSFYGAYIAESNIVNSEWSRSNFSKTNNKNELHDEARIRQLKEIFRQLRFIYQKQGDNILESYFYALEMNEYKLLLKSINPFNDIFWDKLILTLSRWLTDYGRSFLRPFIGILVSNLFILLILIFFFDLESIKIVTPSRHDWGSFNSAIEQYFTIINPIHKIPSSITGWGVMWDLVGRILTSYFIYALIRSSRKFIR